jgi:hypothetical protein
MGYCAREKVGWGKSSKQNWLRHLYVISISTMHINKCIRREERAGEMFWRRFGAPARPKNWGQNLNPNSILWPKPILLHPSNVMGSEGSCGKHAMQILDGEQIGRIVQKKVGADKQPSRPKRNNGHCYSVTFSGHFLSRFIPSFLPPSNPPPKFSLLLV